MLTFCFLVLSMEILEIMALIFQIIGAFTTAVVFMSLVHFGLFKRKPKDPLEGMYYGKRESKGNRKY